MEQEMPNNVYKNGLSMVLKEIGLLILNRNAHNAKPVEFDNSSLLDALLIFQELMMQKMWEFQDSLDMPQKDREIMATKLGTDLRALIRKYTNIDTFKLVQQNENNI